MAGKLRYWKEKDGRFWARMAVPRPIQKLIGRSEIIEPLGGDRREAIKRHPAAVARLRLQITEAEAALMGRELPAQPGAFLTDADFTRAVWQRYTTAIEADEKARAAYPTAAQVDQAKQELVDKVQSAGVDVRDPLALAAASLDFLLLRDAAQNDRETRAARLQALKRELAAGETHQVEHEIDAYLARQNFCAERGTPERAVLAKRMMRAEIEALERTIERDAGNYRGRPLDPVVKEPTAEDAAPPVHLSRLWADYLKSRTQAGFIKDGGKRQTPVLKSLRAFLKHDDAQRVTKKDLQSWRDHLLSVDKLSAKTVNDIYLSTIRSLFNWAHENEHLSENVAATVRQPKPRRVQGRERGYTDAEALAVLKASLAHEPKPNQFGYVRETPHMTAAKRWAPLLCAFSGARISEITQLRREDLRQEGERWVMRITPEAGTVKTGGWRDVPLHRQVLELGFIDFVKESADGPLFHGSADPQKYATAATSVSDELAKWLRRSGKAPEGVQPNHAWRHRLKTMASELGISDRVIDAIQGHAPRTAADKYGDVTLNAKAKAIDALPHFDCG